MAGGSSRPPPAPVTFAQYPSLGPAPLPLPHAEKPAPGLHEYHTAAARRRSLPRAPLTARPAHPPHESRAPVPPFTSHPTASRRAPLARPSHPCIASGRRGCSGGTLVSSCAARPTRRGPRGEAADASGGRARTRPPNTPTTLPHSNPSSRVLSPQARWLACDAVVLQVHIPLAGASPRACHSQLRGLLRVPSHASLTTSFLSLSFFLSPLPLTAAGRRLDECREASYARSVK